MADEVAEGGEEFCFGGGGGDGTGGGADGEPNEKHGGTFVQADGFAGVEGIKKPGDRPRQGEDEEERGANGRVRDSEEEAFPEKGAGVHEEEAEAGEEKECEDFAFVSADGERRLGDEDEGENIQCAQAENEGTGAALGEGLEAGANFFEARAGDEFVSEVLHFEARGEGAELDFGEGVRGEKEEEGKFEEEARPVRGPIGNEERGEKWEGEDLFVGRGKESGGDEERDDEKDFGSVRDSNGEGEAGEHGSSAAHEVRRGGGEE